MSYMRQRSKDEGKPVPSYVRFAIAGLSGMGASAIIQPLDVIKNRMQLSGEGGKKRDHSNSFQAVKNIVKKEGVRGLYQGISATMVRQGTYTTARLGLFQIGVDSIAKAGVNIVGIAICWAVSPWSTASTQNIFRPHHRRPSSVLKRLTNWHKVFISVTYIPTLQAHILVGLVAGCIAGFVGAPPDVAMVRMMADGRLPPAERRNYKHVGDAIYRIAKEEGVFTLWRGINAAVMRAACGNVSQLVTYTQTKQLFINNKILEDNMTCYFLSSVVAGLVYTIVSNPIDIAKTRLQAMSSFGEMTMYSGIFDVWRKTVKKEGFPSLWKGFLPYYLRMAPHTTLLLIFTEQLTYLYRVYVLHETNPRSI